MNTYKVRIRAPGRLGTPLRGDTIFGHVAWGIARREGAEGISRFLSGFDEEPQLVVSSAFPAGFVPMPLLAPQTGTFTDPSSYSEAKRLKKRRYIPLSVFQSGNPVSISTLMKTPRAIEPGIVGGSVLHNTVDRYGNGTLEETGLYEREESWWRFPEDTETDRCLEIHTVSPLPIGRIREIFSWAFESGFGARASTGAGEVILEDVEQEELPSRGSRALALGPFVAPEEKPVPGLRADIFTRRGRLGPEFGSTMNPFKKPIVFFAEGATFDAQDGTQFVGRLLEGVHGDTRIRHQGMAPVLLFKESPE